MADKTLVLTGKELQALSDFFDTMMPEPGHTDYQAHPYMTDLDNIDKKVKALQ